MSQKTLTELSKLITHVSSQSLLDVRRVVAFLRNSKAACVYPDTLLVGSELEQVEEALLRCAKGEPLAYILGEWEFWGMPLMVSSSVLIPRADTECLVESVLQLCRDRATEPLSVLDCGTGCGAIALALAKERPSWNVVGIERSKAAYEVALVNRQRYQELINISFKHEDWNSWPKESLCDVWVSNPPYIAYDDANVCTQVVAYEPHEALFAGDKGFASIASFVQRASRGLNRGGVCVLEHGWQQSDAVCELMLQLGFTSIHRNQDTAGNWRVSSGVFLGEE